VGHIIDLQMKKNYDFLNTLETFQFPQQKDETLSELSTVEKYVTKIPIKRRRFTEHFSQNRTNNHLEKKMNLGFKSDSILRHIHHSGHIPGTSRMKPKTKDLWMVTKLGTEISIKRLHFVEHSAQNKAKNH